MSHRHRLPPERLPSPVPASTAPPARTEVAEPVTAEEDATAAEVERLRQMVANQQRELQETKKLREKPKVSQWFSSFTFAMSKSLTLVVRGVYCPRDLARTLLERPPHVPKLLTTLHSSQVSTRSMCHRRACEHQACAGLKAAIELEMDFKCYRYCYKVWSDDSDLYA
jgi:hypothetical protein